MRLKLIQGPSRRRRIERACQGRHHDRCDGFRRVLLKERPRYSACSCFAVTCRLGARRRHAEPHIHHDAGALMALRSMSGRRDRVRQLCQAARHAEALQASASDGRLRRPRGLFRAVTFSS